MKNLIKLAITTLLISQLTACGSGEPSEAEIEKAMQKSIAMQIAASNGMFDKDDVILRSVKKIGCAEAQGNAGWMCDVDINMKAPFVGERQAIQALRFVESENGWSVIDG